MKQERILSYGLAEKLTEEDISSISAAGCCYKFTGNSTGGPGNWDGTMDLVLDF